MSKYHDLFCAKKRFGSRESTTAIFHALNNAVEVLEVFPDESADAWVLGNGFKGTVLENISRFRPFDWNIVDERYCDVRCFFL